MGALCVCEALNRMRSRGMCRLAAARAAMGSIISRLNPTRSSVTITDTAPASSLSARALQWMGWRTDSEGLVRLAYPASHIDSVGVISTDAAPACQAAWIGSTAPKIIRRLRTLDRTLCIPTFLPQQLGAELD